MDSAFPTKIKKLFESFARDAVSASRTPMGRSYGNQIDKAVELFTAQQQALLDEVEKRLPKRKDHTLSGSRQNAAYKMAQNEIIDRVTETLKQLRKEIV